ncbi:hemin-degrading factor [Hydrogenophaga sp. YM1]|uniref:hemin-degrading factor n=1 Tax=Hydrogenophaga sp. YM1 TaxID=2806262 RepID=UPI00195C5C1A|nr:ChuX/HutX family heme-like substrate-binding protein [Hydrogenophaga sp. YM1]QRR35406.1 hemin-degrading factor [Hydrogenophaga sp. YM1]
MEIHDIRTAYQAARAQGRRARDAAESIGVSEGAALAAHIGADEGPTRAVALRADWLALLRSLKPCGPLLALTRNEGAVHEKTGVYDKLSGEGAIGLALGEDIDLRLFFHQWHAGLAVTEWTQNPGSEALPSLQFFDRHGTAVHKIFLRETSDRAAWRRVVEQWQDPAATPAFEAPASPATETPARVDAKAFSEAWGAMTDTHQFFPLLRQFGVERRQGFRLVEGRYTRRVERGAVRETLTDAAFNGTPIMVFVGSPGCIQIHTGPVKRVEPLEMNGQAWLNVLDPGFNLHLREDLIDEAWVVEKPTSDGVVTSLEAFDARGELMAMFFGARKPGQPERGAWRDVLAQRPTLDAPTPA